MECTKNNIEDNKKTTEKIYQKPTTSLLLATCDIQNTNYNLSDFAES